MAKWRARLDSTCQKGVEIALEGVLIVVERWFTTQRNPQFMFVIRESSLCDIASECDTASEYDTISGCDTALGCHQTWPSGQVSPAPGLTASSHCIVVPHRLTVLSYASSYTSSLYRIVVHRYRTTVPIIVPHRRTASSHRIVVRIVVPHCLTVLSYLG